MTNTEQAAKTLADWGADTIIAGMGAMELRPRRGPQPPSRAAAGGGVMTACLWCHKPLRLTWRGADRRGYDGDGLFCTLRCGYAYAVAAVRSGRVS